MRCATHINMGNRHVVLVDMLRVLVVPDGSGYYARGLEIDYFTCGETAEDAMQRFSNGLGLTMLAHLEKFGDIERLNHPSKPEVFEEYDRVAPKCEMHMLALISMEPKIEARPANQIEFAVLPRAA